jgi:DNA polymerase II large subunit
MKVVNVKNTPKIAKNATKSTKKQKKLLSNMLLGSSKIGQIKKTAQKIFLRDTKKKRKA